MKKTQYRLMIILLCVNFLSAAVMAQQDNVSGITDGPYLFYRDGKIVVKSVKQVAGNYSADSMSFPISAKSKIILNVHLDNHPDWDFTVKLKQHNLYSGCEFKQASKVLVLSDIEGEFEPFRKLLLAAKVIDSHYKWTFGTGRLIIAGDLFDRGKQVCQFLWLLYKLEDEAREKSGHVNVILGNHDIMNLDGDFRYVRPEYYYNAKLMNEPYSYLYASDSELGIWLRSKNIIEKIGGLLVLHGGISPDILSKQMGMVKINIDTRPFFDVRRQNIPDNLRDFFNEKALFWYRGYFLDPKASQNLIDSTLSFYRCKKIIVGHDIIDHVAAFYKNKVIGVDVDEHEGVHEALLIYKNSYYRIDDHGNKQLLFN